MSGSDRNKGGRGEARERLAKRQKGRLRRHVRGYFLAGVLVTAPLGITFYISWLLIRWVDAQVTPLLPPRGGPPRPAPLLALPSPPLRGPEGATGSAVASAFEAPPRRACGGWDLEPARRPRPLDTSFDFFIFDE